jgi:hypothetical protein
LHDARQSITWIQTPFPIETRQESIASLENVEQFGIPRECDIPPAATGKKTSHIRKIAHPAPVENAM